MISKPKYIEYIIIITLVHSYIYNFITVEYRYKEKKMYNMTLETGLTKRFSSQTPVIMFHGYLREKKTIERMRCVHKNGRKRAYRKYY